MFKKGSTVKERANAALANLQRNAHALSELRSRLESRINSFSRGGEKAESCQDLARVLELVKKGELIFREMSGKIESARFLQEFVMIVNSATASIGEIEDDVRELVPTAEAALTEMNDAIARVSGSAAQDSRQEMDQTILAQVSAAIASETPLISANPSDLAKEPDMAPAAALNRKTEEVIEAEGVAV